MRSPAAAARAQPACRRLLFGLLALLLPAAAGPAPARAAAAGRALAAGGGRQEAALRRNAAAPTEQGAVEEVRRHVQVLAADAMQGRLTGSPGAARAADYIAAQLRALGARPLPGAAGYRLPFEFTAGVRDAGTTLRVGERTWGPGAVRGLAFSHDGEVTAPLVFAGYGLVLPPAEGYPYDSYAGLDVRGKIVVLLRYFPEEVDAEARAVLARYSGLRYKAMQARERGALGVIVVIGPRSADGGELVPLSFDTAVAGSGIVAASAAGPVVEALFRAAGRDLDALQAELDTGDPHVAGFDLGIEARLRVQLERERRTGYDVVGVLPATLAPSVQKPWVLLGAHYDHLGRGLQGGSLADEQEAGSIHNGADDNASGVAAVLAAGARLARQERRRNVVLAFWSGEELGLLGASAFLRQAPIPIDQIAAYVNFDMVGRARDNRLVVQAVGTSPLWPSLIERANVPVGFDLVLQEDPYVPTDSSAFHQAGVPTLSLFTGNHDDYHRPSDDADRVNYEDLARVAQFGALLAARLVALERPPLFVAVAPARERGGDRDTVRVFTGTIPDYASDVEGLVLGGVIAGGPADEAGLRAGDVIVQFAGRQITNIYDYTYALDAVKAGEPVKVVFLRAGVRHEATLVPRARR